LAPLFFSDFFLYYPEFLPTPRMNFLSSVDELSRLREIRSRTDQCVFGELSHHRRHLVLGIHKGFSSEIAITGISYPISPECGLICPMILYHRDFV
jgi:hypothetical protein